MICARNLKFLRESQALRNVFSHLLSILLLRNQSMTKISILWSKSGFQLRINLEISSPYALVLIIGELMIIESSLHKNAGFRVTLKTGRNKLPILRAMICLSALQGPLIMQRLLGSPMMRLGRTIVQRQRLSATEASLSQDFLLVNQKLKSRNL